ncbi:MAG: TrkH family potassium uptake protein [Tissierellia bacterium]|nr:TrkH family potassium uptake protein [Tissierellia bacterium]
MNRKIVVYSISRIMLISMALMFIPLFVSIFTKEEWYVTMAFLKSIGISILVFAPLAAIKPKNKMLFIKEGFVITALTWFLISFFGCLPFYFSGQIPHLLDAYFEMVSGLTTTGASIITDLDVISGSILLWRSMSHFIGGMGVLVLALAVLPEISASSVHAMKAEVPGPQFGKLLPKLKSSARILYTMYAIMTAILVLALIIAGMPFVDSIHHALATAGTGGFGIKNGSVAYYNSPIIEIILAVGMLVFGVNFNLYYMILVKRGKDALRSEELKAYLLIVLFATLTIFLNTRFSYEDIKRGLLDSFFTVSSIITTTGFATVDYAKWPTLSKWVIILLMFIGGCAGSTAGGLKVSRVIISLKSAINEVKMMINPERKVALLYDGKPLDRKVERGIVSYLTIYFLLFAILMFAAAIKSPDFESSFSAVITTYNNVGPGLGIVGPTGNYSSFTHISKFVLTFVMIIGRLEIFPVLILFAPSTWGRE